MANAAGVSLRAFAMDVALTVEISEFSAYQLAAAPSGAASAGAEVKGCGSYSCCWTPARGTVSARNTVSKLEGRTHLDDS